MGRRAVQGLIALAGLWAWPGSGLGAGGTPLMDAVANSDLATVRALIEQGTKVNEKDQSGWTPLMQAAAYAQPAPDILRALLAAGAEVNAKCAAGETALMIAIVRRNTGLPDIMQVLLDHGADVNARNQRGQTVLIRAAEQGKFEVLRPLLDRGADPQAKDNEDDTALIAAIRAVAYLPDDVSEEGVVSYDELAVAAVRNLLAKGANPNARNKKGETPLQMAELWARAFGKRTIVEILHRTPGITPTGGRTRE